MGGTLGLSNLDRRGGRPNERRARAEAHGKVTQHGGALAPSSRAVAAHPRAAGGLPGPGAGPGRGRGMSRHPMFMSRHGRAPLELSARPGFPFQAAAYGRCVAAATAGRAELRKDACAQEFEALRACVARAVRGRGAGIALS